MPSKLNPYLSFRDTARPAMEFYRSVFGGQLTLTTFEEYHASDDPAEAGKIMHAMLETEGGITLMAADTPNRMELRQGGSVSLSLSGDDEAELRPLFEKLSRGGQITQPLVRAPWGDTFGECTDQFGVNWMVNIAGQAAP